MQIWKITIVSPTGTFEAQLHINSESPRPAGEMRAKNGSGPMIHLKFESGTIEWATKVERPMPMKLVFKGKYDDRTMSGTVKFGIFASGTFTGILA